MQHGAKEEFLKNRVDRCIPFWNNAVENRECSQKFTTKTELSYESMIYYALKFSEINKAICAVVNFKEFIPMQYAGNSNNKLRIGKLMIYAEKWS